MPVRKFSVLTRPHTWVPYPPGVPWAEAAKRGSIKIKVSRKCIKTLDKHAESWYNISIKISEGLNQHTEEF